MSDLTEMPDDPELAFIFLEERLRAELNKKCENAQRTAPYLYDYMNLTLAAARALNLDFLENQEIPPPASARLTEEYQQFRAAVDHHVMIIQIRSLRRAKRYSVAFDPVTKTRLRHHIVQIKEIVDRLEVDQKKKEAILAKATALEAEIDRDRTRLDVVMALVLEAADTTGEAAKKLKPLRDLLDPILNIFGKAKDADEANPSLPAPGENKRLEPPRKGLPAPDDEVPS